MWKKPPARRQPITAILPQLYEAHRLITRDAGDRAFVNVEAFRTGFLLVIILVGELALVG